MKRLIILIFFVLLIFNCKREYNRNKIEKIEIDPEKAQIGYLSKICDTYIICNLRLQRKV